MSVSYSIRYVPDGQDLQVRAIQGDGLELARLLVWAEFSVNDEGQDPIVVYNIEDALESYEDLGVALGRASAMVSWMAERYLGTEAMDND